MKYLMYLLIIVVLGTGLYEALSLWPEYKPILAIGVTAFIVLYWGLREIDI